MTKEKKKVGKGLDIDLGVVKIGLGGIFKGIENIIDLADKLKEAGGEINKEGEFDLSHLKKGMKGVFGVSIKTAGGVPVVEPFGNIRRTPAGPSVEEEREPITDLFDEKEEVIIIAELPGVGEKDIKLDLKGDILEISAQRGERKFHKEVLIPAEVKAETMSSSYKTGILEVRIKKSVNG